MKIVAMKHFLHDKKSRALYSILSFFVLLISIIALFNLYYNYYVKKLNDNLYIVVYFNNQAEKEHIIDQGYVLKDCSFFVEQESCYLIVNSKTIAETQNFLQQNHYESFMYTNGEEALYYIRLQKIIIIASCVSIFILYLLLGIVVKFKTHYNLNNLWVLKSIGCNKHQLLCFSTFCLSLWSIGSYIIMNVGFFVVTIVLHKKTFWSQYALAFLGISFLIIIITYIVYAISLKLNMQKLSIKAKNDNFLY